VSAMNVLVISLFMVSVSSNSNQAANRACHLNVNQIELS